MNPQIRYNDVLGPWIAFPHIDPSELSAYLKQGVTEAWFDQVWRPFWQSLDQQQRLAYFRHWEASPEWIDAISNAFDEPENFDAAADRRESDAYLQTLRDTQANRPWWKRLFR